MKKTGPAPTRRFRLPIFHFSLFIFHFSLCLSSASFVLAAEPAKILLLGQQPDSHPPTTHEYMAGMRILASCLAHVPEVEATVVQADSPWEDGPELIAKADAIVMFLTEGAKWVTSDPRRHDAFARHAADGKGLVVMHWGMGTREAEPIEPFLKMFGGCHGGPDRKFKVVQDCLVTADERHPVAEGIEDFRILEEEFYYRLKTVDSGAGFAIPFSAMIDGVSEPVSWAWERPDGGRSFGFSGGHFHANWREPAYRRLMTQAVLWTCKAPIPAGGANVGLPEEAYELK
jgi:type 1 glutamine amidotransferase